MSGAGTRVGIGTHFRYDGETVEVVEMAATGAGNEVVLKNACGGLLRVSLKELLFSDRAAIIPAQDGPGATDEEELAGVVLGQLSEPQRRQVIEQAEHVREMLTGFRSGSRELARDGEPHPQFAPDLPLDARYAAKAAELGVADRTVRRWAAAYQRGGEAGLAPRTRPVKSAADRVDERWVETALEVMVEHADASKPSRKMVIDRTRARVIARYGPEVVRLPCLAVGFRVLAVVERRLPLFRLSTKRIRDIADRPEGPFGKLRPTRPGEYLLMDSTRLDVFAFDPLTLRWVRAELSVGMDWYTRCITGLRVTPVSTKAVDVAAVLFESFRPRPFGKDWPRGAVWPEHGIPRTALVDVAVEGVGLASPPIAPETLVVDHGKVYVSDHLSSVCRRMGVSIQPARLRTGRDKGPVERFFRTLREDLLQALPGYKGPDIHSRGEDPEGEAFFFLDELEEIIREWTATTFHCRPHSGLVDPGLPGLRMSPAQMFEHGMARAGHIEVPRDRDLAFEFLPTKWRTIQHYGVEIDGRRYRGPGLPPAGTKSPYTYHGKHNHWPFQVNPDDITKIYFRDRDRTWHALKWEHAPEIQMPLSEEALTFARNLAAKKYTHVDDRLAVADLLERWNAGLGATPAERRMALRLSREQAIGLPDADPSNAVFLPSVRRALDDADEAEQVVPGEVDAAEGDDDAADFEDSVDEDDFYATALKDVDD
ncbi:helix-turn-helix domain-containing protein [Streptomyces sp. NPDC051776]|uniref:Mu transposase C-terminal domain-containing protein n=1 Tax=Streptomyces sp. NPDC051776 TaxID=3155414 RepID=UPI003433EC83